ncbi:hypothetical protein K4H02_27865, partial [Mycobacterium tuberculosis]|nr:hypothetical protein [Mycobacterium tuberculosis]
AIATLEPQLAATAARFADLVALRRQMGFGEEKGLAGEMQNAVNDLDKTFAGSSNPALAVKLLTLRGLGKDYMLTGRP